VCVGYLAVLGNLCSAIPKPAEGYKLGAIVDTICVREIEGDDVVKRCRDEQQQPAIITIMTTIIIHHHHSSSSSTNSS
jgi:hypothetical protein